MEKAFNLLDEPWLPVRLANGRIKELGLLDVFRRSGEITALVWGGAHFGKERV